ncbi:immunoglobulin-like domain-containing protein [Sporosarcina sp. FSL K6-3457]|uniref:immunoglobulin-like domain-containing protein n=1 Tax=Sporosarcina sp. FSL K6-3457 TaxID=2978204 RepID=UPI0030F4D323
MSDEDTVGYVKKVLKLGDTRAIIADISLPTTSSFNTEISWKSSDSSIISEQGAVTRPYAKETATVTLTATISKNAIIATKSFKVVVLPTDGAESVSEEKTDVAAAAVTKTTNQGVWIGLMLLAIGIVIFVVIRKKRLNGDK